MLFSGCLARTPVEPAPVDPVPAPVAPAPAPAGQPAAYEYPPPLAVSPTGGRIAAGVGGLTIYDNQAAVRLNLPDLRPRLLRWAPAGDLLLAVTIDGKAYLVGEKTVDLGVTTLKDEPSAAWSPDGTRILLASWRAPVYEVTAATGAVRQVLANASTVGVLWLPGDQVYIFQRAGCCGSQGGRLDLQSGEITDLGHYMSWAFSPDGRRLATAPYIGGQLTITDLATGKQEVSQRDFPLSEPRPEVEMTGNYKWIVHGWSPDGSSLNASLQPEGGTGMLRVIDLTGERTELVARDMVNIGSWIGPGADIFYATRTDGVMRVFLNGALLSEHPGGEGLRPNVPSPDQTRIAYGVMGPEGALFVADLRTGRAQRVPDSQGLSPLGWTTDDTLLVARYNSNNKLQAIEKLPLPAAADQPKVTEALWGPPGTTVYQERQDRPFSFTYAPFTLKGRDYTPVAYGSDIFLFRRDGGAVYLDGRINHAGGVEIYPEPRLLYRLPLALGTQFGLPWEHHNFGQGFWPWRATAFTAVDGLTAVRLESSQGSVLWSPNVGPIPDSGVQIRHEAPQPLPALATLADGTQAIMVGVAGVQDMQGHTLLEGPDIHPLRSWAVWTTAPGAPSPILLAATHTQAEPNVHYRAFYYDPTQKRFQPLSFHLPYGRDKTILAGDIGEDLLFQDDETYPLRAACRLRWAGDHMECSAYEGGVKVDSEERFVWHFTTAMDEQSWTRLFQDPEKGRATYRDTRPNGRNLLSGAQPRREADGTWYLGGFRITLAPLGDEWRVAAWKTGSGD